MEQAEKGQVKSLVKALELLDILSNKQAPMTLRELYQASGYPKSTIYALLSTLRAYGCIRQESDGRYYLGMKLFQWGCSVSASWDEASPKWGGGRRNRHFLQPHASEKHEPSAFADGERTDR